MPPQRKSSNTKSQSNKDEEQELQKQKLKIESKNNVISPNRKKSSRVPMRRLSSTQFTCEIIVNYDTLTDLAVEEETFQTPTWTKEDVTPSIHAPPQVSRKISRTGSIPFAQPSEHSIMDLGDLMESSDLAELSNEIPIEKSTSPVAPQRKDSCDEDSWDKLYNETGDLLRPDALEEVKNFIPSFESIRKLMCMVAFFDNS